MLQETTAELARPSQQVWRPTVRLPGLIGLLTGREVGDRLLFSPSVDDRLQPGKAAEKIRVGSRTS